MISGKNKAQRIGITCSTFDLFHAGHIVMLEEAKRQCDWLIAAIQLDPTLDRPGRKNKPVQSIIERQLQVSACRHVDEIIVYSTEKELEDIFLTFPLDVRIIGEEYKETGFTAKQICIDRGIEIYYNKRDHYFSSTDLRSRVFDAELKRRGAQWDENTISNASNVMQSSK
jgi:glycerol-3-phosphate cytidylyltransferase